MGVPLELNEAWLARLEAFFRKINRPMSPLNRIQAMIPRGATIIENTAGTAAGIRATLVIPVSVQSKINNPKSKIAQPSSSCPASPRK